MPSFLEYLRNITYYLLFASLIGLAAPAGKYRQYVKLVTGIILVLLIIRPLGNFSRGTGVPVTDWFLAAHVSDTADYTGMYASALHSAFEEQLRVQLEALLNQNGYELSHAEFSYQQDFSRIDSLSVTVSAPGEDGKRPFIRIEPVRIGGADGDETESQTADDVKKLISGFYHLPMAHIHVKMLP
jgi:hypothetical protein